MMISHLKNWTALICISFLIQAKRGARGQISDNFVDNDDAEVISSLNHGSQSTDGTSYDMSEKGGRVSSFQSGDVLDFDLDENEVVDLDVSENPRSGHENIPDGGDFEAIYVDSGTFTQSTDAINSYIEETETIDLDDTGNPESYGRINGNYSDVDDARSSTNDAMQTEIVGLESTTKIEENKTTQIFVEDYLSSLTEEDLREICIKRGLDVGQPQDRTNETNHEYFVEAARRCINIEKEIDAIIAENPDLAAELEAEIDRMKAEKERLEAERQDMINQISLLQSELRDKGVSVSSPPSVTPVYDTNDMSTQDVLTKSFQLLWERVYQDIKMIHSVISFIMRPLMQLLVFAWRHSQPTVEAIARSVLLLSVKYLGNEKVTILFSHIISFARYVAHGFVAPIFHSLRDLGIRKIDEISDDENIKLIVSKLQPVLGPFVAQLRCSALELKRKLSTAKDSTVQWAMNVLEDETR